MTKRHATWPSLLILIASLAMGCPEDEANSATDTGAGVDVAVGDVVKGGDASAPDASVDTGPSAEQAAVLAVPETERWTMAGLSGEVHVLRTEGNIAHIYAENRLDMARVLGFVQARDRFFFMDLQRRLGLGTISEILGADGLANDIESRMNGLTATADRLYANTSDDFRAYLQAFADGVNYYIAQAKAGEVPPPDEVALAGGLLGLDDPNDLMQPMDVRGVIALAAVVLYESNFETGDLGRSAALTRLADLFTGAENEALRKSGYLGDVWNDIRPIFPGSSTTEGFGTQGLGASDAVGGAAGGNGQHPASHMPAAPKMPQWMLDEHADQMLKFVIRTGRDRERGAGSNSWAVAGTHSTDGMSLMASDGHLSLSVPAIPYPVALDTTVFGDGDITQYGGWLGNFPAIIGGTNGKIAFGGVNPVQDITDWYREEIQLDADGKPATSLFEGEQRALVGTDETFDVADIPLLGSTGRTETWTRYTTFDGRWINKIEGREVASVDEAGPGESVVNMVGKLYIPEDTDGDGVITAISFKHGALDATKWHEALYDMGNAADVYDFREAMKGYVGGGLYTTASDSKGNIFFTSWLAVPCRDYLEKVDGLWTDGSDPNYLLDGTKYGAFSLPTGPDGKVDEAAGAADPYKCVIPFDEVPQVINPEKGYFGTANNDPGGLTDDGDHTNDQRFLGGPWASVRANTILRELAEAVGADAADIAKMAEIQANKDSRLGEIFVPYLLTSIAQAKAWSEGGGTADAWEDRAVALYDANVARFDEVATRLAAWSGSDYRAASGVETFYEAPTALDLEDAVATMIFNAWFPRFNQAVWNDEGINAWRASSSRQQVASLRRFLEARDNDNAASTHSWDAATSESVFFDKVGTADVERSDELMLAALAAALDFLEGPGDGPGKAGFATADMSQWLWGLRHQTMFTSILGDFLDADSSFGFLIDEFSITTEKLPLADSIPAGDPRKGLKWFPRGGDNWGVDAANPGLSGTKFTHGSGPVMRMVVGLKGEEVKGLFIIPGGQSALIDSPHFSDQAALWLANDAFEMRFYANDVAAGATGHEVYTP